MSRNIKKVIKIAAPYLLAVMWFLYCYSEIEESVLNHFGYGWCVIDSYALGVFSVFVLVVARIFKKEVYQYYFVPVVFYWCGIILGAIGHSIPCCTGG